MAVQTKNETTKANIKLHSAGKKNTPGYDAVVKLSKYLSHEFHTLLIMLVLKYYSNKKHPLSVTDLHKIISSILPVGDQKTTSRKLKALEELLSTPQLDFNSFNIPLTDDDEDLLAKSVPFINSAQNLLRLIFCGTLHKYKSPTKKGIAKYYFEPILNTAHIKMLKSSIISNQYLSNLERSLLLSAVSTLEPTFLPDKDGGIFSSAFSPLEKIASFAPEHKNTAAKPADYSLLQHITLLYDAISNGWQIRMLQGSYQGQKGKDGKNKTIELVPTYPNRPYLLNPYALFFQNGHQYLLATKEGDTQPWHFRVDRICSVEILEDESHPGTPRKREPVPQSLGSYYSNETNSFSFNETRYSQTHPLMAIYKKNELIDCELRGGSTALSVMADYFGKENIRILSEEEASEPEDKRKKIFTFKVIRAQKEALELLCSQQHMLLTVLKPDALIASVKQNLQNSLDQYNHAP